jgi:hypothetical protein
MACASVTPGATRPTIIKNHQFGLSYIPPLD